MVRALLFVVLSAACAAALPAQTYQTVEVHGFGGLVTSPTDLNDSGQVVGQALAPGPGSRYRAFLWERGRVRNLGVLPGSASSRAVAVNESGTVAGNCGGSASAPYSPDRAFLWSRGTMRELPPLPGHFHSRAAALNDRGEVAGQSWIEDPADAGRHDWSPPGHPPSSPVLWIQGVPLDVGVLPGHEYGTATGIDARGRVVGYSWSSGDDERAFVWEAGNLTALSTLPGGREAFALGVSENGLIHGMARNAQGRIVDVLWRRGVIEEIEGARGSFEVRSSNAYGHLAGSVLMKLKPYSALFQNGEHLYPGSSLPAGRSDKAVAINDLGMVAISQDRFLGSGAFLLVPDLLLWPPEPGVAGQPNALEARGASPRGSVVFALGTRAGSLGVPGCPGVRLGFRGPRVLGPVAADDGGVASLVVQLPAQAAGRTLHFQALEPSRCAASNLVSVQIQ